jgi:hypothetical protein
MNRKAESINQKRVGADESGYADKNAKMVTVFNSLPAGANQMASFVGCHEPRRGALSGR